MEDEIINENLSIEEFKKMFGNVGFTFYPIKLIYKLFDSLAGKHRGDIFFAVCGIYYLGYMRGVRTEREKRRKKAQKSNFPLAM
jgi:hypothetical protein